MILLEKLWEKPNTTYNQGSFYKNDDEYKVVGELIKGDKKISSWVVVLERQPTATSNNKH